MTSILLFGYLLIIFVRMEANPSQPREKIMTHLHRGYSTALLFLKQGKVNEGVEQLQQILQHEFMSDTDMENLKYSSLMSLATVHEQRGEANLALGKYWQALQILSRRSAQALQKGLSSLKQYNEERCHSQFTILLKMISIAEQQHLPDQQIYLLKKAITLSPSIWRDSLLEKLARIYQQQNCMEAYQDLSYLMANKKKLEEVLAENLNPAKEVDSKQKIMEATSSPLEGYLKRLTLRVNAFQKEEQKLKYSSWETLLTMTYVLLKCQLPRNFNKKKYKKIEETKQWSSFVKEYNPLKTNIEVIVDFDEGESRMQVEGQGENYTKVIGDLTGQLLKAQYLKKKPKKQANPLEQLTRNPSFTSKDKKQSITQTKSIYTSITEYYKDLFVKTNFKKEMLNAVKFLDEDKFNEIFGKIFASETEPVDKKDEENEDDQEEKSPQIQGQTDKEAPKEKKSLKNRKMETLTQHDQLNNTLKTQFEKSILFTNIYEVIQYLTQTLIAQKINSQANLLAFPSIRKIMQKNILKVIQGTSGYFMSYLTEQSEYSQQRLQFLELLVEKTEHLADKQCKNKIFKQYEEIKRNKLVAFIKQHFTPSIQKTRNILEGNQLYSNQWSHLAQLCSLLIRVNYLYGAVKPSEITYYRGLHLAFKDRQEGPQFAKKAEESIDLQLDRLQKKITSRSSLLVITEQTQENIPHNIDEIFKKDHELAVALPLLKVFNCFSDHKIKGESYQTNNKTYIESFVKVCEVFFRKVQAESSKQFNSRLLSLLAELMRIRQVIGDIYDRLMHNETIKLAEVPLDIFIGALYHLIRLYLLNLNEDNDNCIRVIFYLSSLIFRQLPEETKFATVPRCLCLFDQLIKYKKFKPELSVIVRKKFYQNLILKNLHYIYNSPTFKIVEQPSKKKNKRKNSSRSDSQQISEKAGLQDQNLETRDRIDDILREIYFCSQKDREFNPKKIQEAVGYFMYLLWAYRENFMDPVVDLNNDACRIIKKCYKLYSQKRNEVFQYCQRFSSFKTTFQAVMAGDESPQVKAQFSSILRKETPICDCCNSIRQKYGFYVESLFLIGKIFQSQIFRDDVLVEKEQLIADLDKDQAYYYQYLALNLDNENAWENLVRVNANKSYTYFDSLMAEPFQLYKGKFLYTKRILKTIDDYFPHFEKLNAYSNQKQHILNTLKMKEREYYMILKEIQVKEATAVDCRELKEYRDLKKKYKEGLKKVLTSLSKKKEFLSRMNEEDVRLKYLRVVEIKMKLVWMDLEKQREEERKNEDIIELDRDEEDLPKTPNNIIETVDILSDIRAIIQDLPIQEKNDCVIHLEEDLVVETYMFLYNSMDFKLDRIIQAISQGLKCSNASQLNRYIKDAQYYHQDLSYTLAFLHSSVISGNDKYRIRAEMLNVQANDIEACSDLFSTLFLQEKDLEAIKKPGVRHTKKIEEHIMQEEKKNQEAPLQVLDRKSSNSEKQQTKGKQIHIDVASYFAAKLRESITGDKSLKNLTKFKDIIFHPNFLEEIQKASKIMSQLIRIFTHLPKYQQKRWKNRRSVGMGLLQSSIIVLKYANLPDRANDLIKQFYNLKTDELVTINIHNERIATQKNQLLSEFYNRVLVHQIMKIKFIQHLFKIYQAQGNKENLVMLNRKLLKLSKGNEKAESKAQKEKEKAVPASVAAKNPVEVDEEKKQGELKDKQKEKEKQPKEPKAKQKQQKQQEIRCYFLLFCEGVSTFVDILKSQSIQKPVDQKYQKNLLQFKNRIKKSMQKDEINYYYNKIQEFLMHYEHKYGKKIKMKKSKKDKDGENQKMEEIMEPQKRPMVEEFKKILEQKKEVILIEIEPEDELQPVAEVQPEMPERVNSTDPAIIEEGTKRKRKKKNLDISVASNRSPSRDNKPALVLPKQKKIKKADKQQKQPPKPTQLPVSVPVPVPVPASTPAQKTETNPAPQKIARRPRQSRRKKGESPHPEPPSP